MPCVHTYLPGKMAPSPKWLHLRVDKTREARGTIPVKKVCVDDIGLPRGGQRGIGRGGGNARTTERGKKKEEVGYHP